MGETVQQQEVVFDGQQKRSFYELGNTIFKKFENLGSNKDLVNWQWHCIIYTVKTLKTLKYYLWVAMDFQLISKT